MIKLIAFLKARPGMSRTEFIEYYENRHVPLIQSIAPQIAAYRRSYIQLPPLRNAQNDDSAICDVVTELEFVDIASFDAAMHALSKSNEIIRADEKSFLDVDAIRLYQVDTSQSSC